VTPTVNMLSIFAAIVLEFICFAAFCSSDNQFIKVTVRVLSCFAFFIIVIMYLDHKIFHIFDL